MAKLKSIEQLRQELADGKIKIAVVSKPTDKIKIVLIPDKVES